MARYRKVPVEVEAVGPIEEVEYIETLEGVMRADVGDYIITGVQGERYPCKPAIFEATYERVEESPITKAADKLAQIQEQIDSRLSDNEREKVKENGQNR